MQKLVEKRLKVARVKDILTGNFDINQEGFRHVKSIAIFSCQSPTSARIKVDGEPGSLDFEVYLEKYKHITLSAWNEESMQKAKRLLRKYRFRIVDGLYEGHEKSFIVFNMTRGEVEWLNKMFYQQAYMFINLVDRVDPKIGSGKIFGVDASGNNVGSLTRKGINNEAAKQVAFMEMWERVNNIYEYGKNINNRSDYELKETSFGITLDTSFMKDPSHPSEEDKFKYQTRVSKDLGFTALYTDYNTPDDYEGDPLNLQLKESFTDSDFEDVYKSSL